MSIKHEHDGDFEKPAKKLKLNGSSTSLLIHEQVGITEYVAPQLQAVKGIIKQRFTDFIVSEIDKNEKIARLTSLSLSDTIGKREKKENNVTTTTHSKSKLEWPVNAISELEMISFNTDTISRIKEMFESQSKEVKFVEIPPVDDKTQRTLIHKKIREIFQGHIISETNSDNNIIMRFSKNNTQNRSKGERERGPSWSELGGEYVKFILYKENRDTMDAISFISRLMRIPSKRFSYAGTKDRRGVTTQWVTLQKVTADRVQGLNKSIGNMKVGNFEYVQESLELGDLKGNEFVITLRNISANDEVIKLSMESLRDKGFINYYGMQRFGTSTISTHDIGKALLCGKWREAVDMILCPRECDKDDIDKARKFWKEKQDAKAALELFPKRCIAEQSILKTFIRVGNSNDCATALSSIPRNLRMLYAHAYQSYVWNQVTSARIKLGLDIREGDLVYQNEEEDKNPGEENMEEDYDSEEENKNKSKRCLVKILSKEDLTNYTIYDVVLPTPGTDIIYPTGKIGELYKTIMEKDGLDYLNLYRKVKEYSLFGSYRKIISKPSSLKWKILRYNDGEQQLYQTDMDKLLNKEILETPEGKFRALQMCMCLSSAEYATMALREVIKEETSSNAQAAMTLDNVDMLENAKEKKGNF